MIKLTDGCIGVGENPNDFLMSGDVQIPELPEQDETIFEYNQYTRLETTNACTMYGSFGSLSDLVNYEFTKTDVDGVMKLANTRGWINSQGRYTQNGVKCVCDRWNTNKQEKVVFFQVDLLGSKAVEALVKGYSLVVSYRGNDEYNDDYQKDNTLECKELKGLRTYGHCTRIRLKDKKDIKVVDSARGTPYNQYIVKYLSDLVKNNIFYQNAYLIIPEKLMKSNKEQIAIWNEMAKLMQVNIENNSRLWQLTSDPKFKIDLHDINNDMRTKLKFIQSQI